MNRVAIVARLKPGTATRAAELVAVGPPFDLGESGITAHRVYVSTSEVVFVFEGDQVEWIVDDLIYQPFHYQIYGALNEWRKIVDGQPRLAREHFSWARDESAEPLPAGATPKD